MEPVTPWPIYTVRFALYVLGQAPTDTNERLTDFMVRYARTIGRVNLCI
jgi:hypothetical protein